MVRAGIEALSPGTNPAADGYGQVTVEKGGERKKAEPSGSRKLTDDLRYWPASRAALLNSIAPNPQLSLAIISSAPKSVVF
jgi:hypothetical protein